MNILNLFRPKWKHSNLNVRKKAINEIDEEGLLLEIAKNDKDFGVKETAIRRISSQEFLEKIAVNETDYEIKKLAVLQITDQQVLAQIALKNDDFKIAYNALKNINEQAILQEIAEKHADQEVRKIAVSKITNQDTLSKIAVNDEHILVKQEAIQKIRDSSILEKIAVKEKNGEIRRIAYSKITNQTFLKSALEREQEKGLRNLLLGKIEDTSVLLANIKTIRDRQIRKKIVYKILKNVSDLDVFLSLFNHEDDLEIRCLLLKKIDNPKVLFELATKDENSKIRKEAIGRLTDQSLLVDITSNEQVPYLRFEALKGITAESSLYEVVMKGKGTIVRAAAIERLDSIEMLRKAADNSEYWMLQKFANSKRKELSEKCDDSNSNATLIGRENPFTTHYEIVERNAGFLCPSCEKAVWFSLRESEYDPLKGISVSCSSCQNISHVSGALVGVTDIPMITAAVSINMIDFQEWYFSHPVTRVLIKLGLGVYHSQYGLWAYCSGCRFSYPPNLLYTFALTKDVKAAVIHARSEESKTVFDALVKNKCPKCSCEEIDVIVTDVPCDMRQKISEYLKSDLAGIDFELFDSFLDVQWRRRKFGLEKNFLENRLGLTDQREQRRAEFITKEIQDVSMNLERNANRLINTITFKIPS